MSMSKITPFLWFTAPQALHAAEFYVELFNKNPLSKSKSTITRTTNYAQSKPDDTEDTCKPADAGSILTVEFSLAGQSFTAMNGNKEGTEMPWKFNEAISFSIACDTQEEIDYFWDAITNDGGAESYCGWCKDRWGVSWQVVPAKMGEIMSDSDPAGKERATQEMLKMKKLDLDVLQAAARGE